MNSARWNLIQSDEDACRLRGYASKQTLEVNKPVGKMEGGVQELHRQGEM